MNRNCNRSTRFNLLALTLLAICPILLAAPPAHASTILVNIDPITGAGVVEVDAGDGLCSLKEAIVNANNGALTHADCMGGTDDANTIVLPTSAVFTLTGPESFGNFGVSGLPEITSEITIAGNSATIQRDPALVCNRNGVFEPGDFRLLLIREAGKLTIEDLTLANGCADGLGNTRLGGGIFNQRGTLILRRSTIHNNTSLAAGGGLYVMSDSPETLIEDSTVSGNTASAGAGLLLSSSATVRNSTLSGNAADLRGGGIAVQGNIPETNLLTLDQVSFVDNSAPEGSGINARESITNARNLIMHNSDCVDGDILPEATWISAGASLDSGTTCANVFGSNFTANAVTNLGSLADNGGPTQTHALLPGSMAIDAVPAGNCSESADQRGVPRPQGSACDIGAYELVNAMPMANAGPDQTTTAGNLVTLDGSSSFDPDGHVPLTYAWLQIAGDSVALSNAGAAMPTFSAPLVEGTLVFELIVTDSYGLASDPDTVTVTVAPDNIFQDRLE